MSDFEFLRHVTIGQFVAQDSPLRRRDSRARLVAILCLLMGVTFASHPLGLLLGLLLTLLGLWLGHVPLAFALRGLLPPLPFLLFLALLQVWINPLPDRDILWQAGTLVLSRADLWAGFGLLVRFSTLLLLLTLATFSMSTMEMTRALGRLLSPLGRLGLLTQDVTMAMQITLRFLPLLAQTAERIAKAQAARGLDWERGGRNLFERVRQILPMLTPLFVNSLRRAEQMALAMDSRAYATRSGRSSWVEYHFNGWDAALVLLALGGAVAMIRF
jgi:energy-coupling factor transport system permease protein